MPVDVNVPQLGESIVEATVGRWFKRAGDAVAEGESLVELETDKVNVEVPAPSSGVLERIIKEQGQTVNVGDVIAVVGAAAGVGAAGAAASPSTVTAPAGVDAVAATNGREPAASVGAPEMAASATPLARRMAAERGVPLDAVAGSGPGGRITQHDVTAYLAGQIGATAAAPGPAAPAHPAGAPTPPTAAIPTPPAAPDASARPTAPAPPAGTGAEPEMAAREERVRLSRRRQTIARRLVEAQHTAAMLTTFNEVDMSAILNLRQRRRDPFKERHGVSLGFMSFFTRAVVGVLKGHPRLNAEIQGEEMVLKHYYNIGIAVATEEGLVVPVIHDADRLSFAEIERHVATLAQKARARSLSLAELQDGTFTITNGGVFGSLLSTPILNAPQVGILGMHKIQERPIALNGQVVIHPMMYLALSYDHRLVDGDEAVTFLVRVKELLEDPEALLLEG